MERTIRIDTMGDFNICLTEQTDQKPRGRIQDLNYVLSRLDPLKYLENCV